jgi:peptidoglycan/LPS O-acetylase OafA/YrhL
VWRFYLSRYARLLPPYLVALAVTAIVWSNQLAGPGVPCDRWQHCLFKFSGVSLIGIDLTAFYNVDAGYPECRCRLSRA